MYNNWLKYKCLMKKIFFKFSNKNLYIQKDLMFRNGFFIKILGGRVRIGNGCFFNNYCSINSLGKIEIGENCIFGENVKIYDHNHKFSKESLIKNSGYSIGEIIIKNNVWVGSNVVILKDVTIGNNVVIGAGCIVRENIPDNSVVISTSKLLVDKMN